MPNFKSISFKMAVLQGGGQILPPPHVCVIQKTPCGIGLIMSLDSLQPQLNPGPPKGERLVNLQKAFCNKFLTKKDIKMKFSPINRFLQN